MAIFLHFFVIQLFKSENMSSQFPRPMFVDNFSPFPPWCDSGIKDDSCLFTIGNDRSPCSVAEKTILSERGDVSVTHFSNVLTLNSRSFSNKTVTRSVCLVKVDEDGCVQYKRMSFKCGAAKGSISVSESIIPVELENAYT